VLEGYQKQEIIHREIVREHLRRLENKKEIMRSKEGSWMAWLLCVMTCIGAIDI
jgi:hypothetical protein